MSKILGNGGAKLDTQVATVYIASMTNIDPRTIALGREIRAEAAAQRITIDELAKRAGVSRASLYNWADAKVSMPIAGLMSLSVALGVPAYELLRRAEERARRNAEEV